MTLLSILFGGLILAWIGALINRALTNDSGGEAKSEPLGSDSDSRVRGDERDSGVSCRDKPDRISGSRARGRHHRNPKDD